MSSVPSAQISSSGANMGGAIKVGTSGDAKMISYCSYFAYCSDSVGTRKYVTEQISVEQVLQSIKGAESKSFLFDFRYSAYFL